MTAPRARVRARLPVCGPILLVCACLLTVVPAPGPAHGQERRAEISASTTGGFGRMIFRFDRETGTEVKVANGILVITFDAPVSVSVERLERALPGYVQAARRDPDGRAVRVSLPRRIRVNAMPAGEKLFIDLLPESWTGLPPGLPQEVVDELARRAREAEQRAREQAGKPATPIVSPVRLRLATAPTFRRLAFEMEQPIPVTPTRDGQELRLRFNAPVKIDLGEARAQLPDGVVGLDVDLGDSDSTVKLVLAPDAQARSFREGNLYIVDVTPLAGAAPGIADIAAETAKREAASAALAGFKAAPRTELAAPGLEPVAMPPGPIDPTWRPMGEGGGPVVARAKRESGRLVVSFPFEQPVNAAVFQRADTVWIVFDTSRKIDLKQVVPDPAQILDGAELAASEFGAVVRLKLARPRLPSVARDGATWVLTLGDGVATPSRPLPTYRTALEDNRAAVLVPMELPGQVHRLSDPEIGDSLLVVTAPPPARGILRSQQFVDFNALASVHGLALVPRADDVAVTLSADGATVRRPGGLAISEMPEPPPPAKEIAKREITPLDPELWKAERDAPFAEREPVLLRASAEAKPGQRAETRIVLARFYLAHEFAAETLGVLSAGAQEDKAILNHPQFHLLRGIAEWKLGRAEIALQEFTRQTLSGVQEAILMRAIAYAELGRWSETREAIRIAGDALDRIPPDLRAEVLMSGLRAAVEVRDFAEASRLVHELDTMELPARLRPRHALLSGRVAEGVGQFARANRLYDGAMNSESSPVAAEARLRSIEMRLGRGELDRLKAIDRLEALHYGWRGDRIELETMRLLARLYVAETRYRDAFRLLDSALLINPESEVTQAMQRELAAVFEDLFLTGKSEMLPPVHSLALYYDFSKLTPIGRRGDELIRRLADRLMAVELFDQAAELLDHQVEYRLSGIAKAQVAAKLALVHLLNRKPKEAVRVLVGSRVPQMPQDLREQRQLLEARALAETGRYDAALEVMQSLSSPEAERLRADIAWSAKRWREAGERIEILLGERWKGEEALDEVGRHDVLRAALAYAMGNETIGLSRLREKYARRLVEEAPERAVLDLLASPEGTNAETLTKAAKALASFDSLGTFLKMYRMRYPERPLPPDPLPTAGVAPALNGH